MKTRAKSALVMAPLLIIVFLGGYFLIAGVFALSLYALREYSAVFGERKPTLWALWTSLGILYAGFVALQVSGGGLTESQYTFTGNMFWMLCWLFVSLALCFASTLSMGKKDILNGMATIVGVLYINFFAFHLVLVDVTFAQPFDIAGAIGLSSALYISGLRSYVWIVVLAAFGTDIFAYLTGKLLGRHKLMPSVSPNKTVEGSIGGIAGSVVLCGLYAHFFLPQGFQACILIGILGGVVSQLGDLSASAMKRRLGIKDWGTLIPGHGGVLDRIDSLLFTAPLVFYTLALGSAVLGFAI